MSSELPQAGNRAGKTRHYLQWRENKPEWVVVTSGEDSQDNYIFTIFQKRTCSSNAAAPTDTLFDRYLTVLAQDHFYSDFLGILVTIQTHTETMMMTVFCAARGTFFKIVFLN